MPFVPLILIAILALLIIASSSYSQSKTVSASSTTSTVTVQRIESLSKARLEEMLGNLEKDNAPEPKMGAMCYSPAPPLERAEYVCPSCGEKTIYGPDQARFVQGELQACRKDFDEIKKASSNAIKLDESSFCKKCSPNAKAHALTLMVSCAGGKEQTTSPVTQQDLRLLRDFLKGKRSYTTFNDGELPLKEQAPRLRQLLGLAQNTPEKP